MRDYGPMLKIAGLFVAVAGVLAVLVIFVILPLFAGKPEEPVVEVSSPPTPSPTPVVTGNISDSALGLTINYKSINDPFVFGTELVFTSGDPASTAPEIKDIDIFDMTTGQTAAVPGITKKYDNLFEPKMNDKYIVYLDCKSEDGGAVCGYDRAAGTSFVMREYVRDKPEVSLSGNYALWLQQTGDGTDKLYLYNLETKEAATIEVFENTEFFISAPYMSDDKIIYVQPEGEDKVLDRSSKSTKPEISILSLTDKGDTSRETFVPEVFVYGPMINGNDIVFLNGAGDENSSLMYVKKDGANYSAPVEIAKDVLNYSIGDGFVAYTKDEAVNIYYFKDGSTGTLSSDTTKTVLASVNGKDVLWYDITDSSADVGDVVWHIQAP
jgi:hypothetical protein